MWNIEYGSVKKIFFFRCTVGKQWKKHINTMKNFSSNWISPGSESVLKDSVEKHVWFVQHLEAVDNVQSFLSGAA